VICGFKCRTRINVARGAKLLRDARERDRLSAQLPIAVGEIAHLEAGAAGVFVSSDRGSGTMAGAGEGAGAAAGGGLAAGLEAGR